MTPGSPTRMAAWLESAWLARYLDRQLDGEELAWFEAYLLDKPELLDMVEADNALRDTLAAMPAREGGGAEATPNAQQDARRVPPRSSARSWMAIVASLVLGIGAGWFSHRSAGPAASDQVVVNPARVVFDTMRGEPVEPHVERAESAAEWLLVEVSVPSDASGVLLRMSGQAVRSLQPSPDGFVSFLVPRHALAGRSNVLLEYMESGERRSRELDLIKYAKGHEP